MTDRFRYAGWFTLDIRVIVTLVVFATAVALLVVAVKYWGKRWEEQVLGFSAVFVVALAVAVVLTNLLGAFPAVRIETFFLVP
jgi:hypothetical protein